METIDIGRLRSIHGQVAFFDQTVQYRSCSIFGLLKNSGGLFCCDFSMDTSLVHALQEFGLCLCQGICGKGGIHQAALKGIHHIRHEGGQVKPLVIDSVEHCLRIQQTVVIPAELVIDGTGQGQILYFLIPAMIQLRSVQNSCRSAISIAKRMQIDKVEMRRKGMHQ